MESKVISNLKEQIALANEDEKFVVDLLNNATLDFSFEWCGQDKEHYHDGDILIDSEIWADVKTDSCIWRTGNILAEHAMRNRSGVHKGFMQIAHYDFMFYLSKEDKKIYVLDFKKLQEMYLKIAHKHLQINHNNQWGQFTQSTDAYFVSLKNAAKYGILVCTIEYDGLEIVNIEYQN